MYNGAEHIRGCIDALKAQTHQDLDIVFVVDSKTSDGSAELIRSLTAGWNAVRVFIQTDSKRLAGARNVGLREINGEWVWCLDVDDRPYPTLIEDLLRITEENDADVAVCNSIFTRNRDIPEKVYGRYSVRSYRGIDAAIAVCLGELSPSPWCKLYSVDFLRSNGLEYREGFCEDLDYTIRAFIRAGRVMYYNKPLYLYYQHEASMCGGRNDDGIAERDVELASELAEEVRSLHADRYDEFCAAMGRHVIRSLTRASKGCFEKLSRSETVTELMGHRQRKFHPEVLLFKITD